jgi:hypothetical protein
MVSVDVTACVHEADLLEAKLPSPYRVVIVQPQDNASIDVRAGLNLIENES